MGHTRNIMFFISTRSTTISIILLIASLAHINALDENVPEITPSDPDVTYLPDENHSFSCQSTEPIKWLLPMADAMLQDFREKIETIHSTDGNLYESTLKLSQIDHNFVGYYYCVKEAVAEENIEDSLRNGNASRIYLFVYDPTHPVYESFSPNVDGYQDSSVVIPCKPTSKNFTVKLVKQQDELHKFESTFDPTEGFRIPLSGLTDGGDYSCHCEQNETYEAHFNVEVHLAAPQLPIEKPKIFFETGNYGIVGQDLNFTCTTRHHAGSKLYMVWLYQRKKISLKGDRVRIIEPHRAHLEDPSKVLSVGNLIVQNAQKQKDEGYYTCQVYDDAKHSSEVNLNVLKILRKDEYFVEIEEPSNTYEFTLNANQPMASLNVKYAGYPTPNVTWRDPKDNVIPWSENKDNKFEAIKGNSSTILRIHQPQIGDSGAYTLHADNGKMETKRQFQLMVKAEPDVSLSDVKIKPDENATLTCNIYGFPPSNVTWSYLPCKHAVFSSVSSCSEDGTEVTFTDEIVKTEATTQVNQTSTLMFRPNSTGIVTCAAKNNADTHKTSAYVIVSDLSEDLLIWSTNDFPIAIGDEVFLTCGASAHKYTDEIKWFKDNITIEESTDKLKGPRFLNNNTPFSYQITLHWKSIPKEAYGIYSCQTNTIKHDSQEQVTWPLVVIEPIKAHIFESNIDENEKIHKFGETLQLTCMANGVPRPTIQWYKDDQEIMAKKDTSFIANGTTLNKLINDMEDEGSYKCVVSNRIGSDFRKTDLKIKNAPKVNRAIIVGVIVVILILVLCTIYLCLRIRRDRLLFRELKKAGLANFERGNPDSINPELAVDEQADLLPYDKKYEFPREKIKLGKQLGAGAFGVVIKGYAQGILPYEEETIVAVKMVKQMADNEVMRALISELKIMVHLGQHLNVVNLLGAVTKNITKREVMVIVEYCRFGNLQNFLVKHREYFIDQIVRDKDIIDPTILTKDQRWSNDSGYVYNRFGLKYIKLSFPNKKQIHCENDNRPESDRRSLGAATHVNSAYIPHSNAKDFFPGGMDSANTEATLITRNTHPDGEDNMVLSNNSTQPAWRSNYRMDYKGPARSVTTTDLLCWAFQVARGMEYLASRKVLHGDLAARNILLCNDNVVKICDFGLARSMYKSDNYRKKGESPLPFKWLALESIRDQMFSTYSDIWSFGIVLWELFSLGNVPYPGMNADQDLYNKLKDGYRMEKPDFATQDIYEIMLSCWCANPESRPLFHSLEKSIGKLLENGVAEHYIDLNEPYLKSNVNNFDEGHVDYLSCMAAPDCPPPAIPSYVNGPFGLLPQASTAPMQNSYITMKNPPTINSSMSDGVDISDTHFQFSPLNSPTTANNLNTNEQGLKLRNKIPNIPEEMPMLKRSNQSMHSDSDTDTNYMNIPSAISAKTDAFSNPVYVVVSNVNETRT